MTPLEQLAHARFYGVGVRDYGHYKVGRYDTETRRTMSREELADVYNYSVRIDRIEAPFNEHERRRVILALHELWAAIDAQAAATVIESPGHPEAGDPPDRAIIAPDPAASGPPAFMGG